MEHRGGVRGGGDVALAAGRGGVFALSHSIQTGGSHAGHNGLRDIHAQLATGDYWRLRLGVGHPGNKDEVVDWVLRKPMAEHRAAIEDGITRSLKGVPALLAGEMDKATMMIHTSAPVRPRPPRKDLPAPSDESQIKSGGSL